MNLSEILAGSGGLLLIFLTLIQLAPIKINPWSWLAKQFEKAVRLFGRALNSEVLEEISEIKEEQKETQVKLDKHIKDDEEQKADQRRQRILRFNTELVRNEKHTHEYFIEALTDIDKYEQYCQTHPEYKNNRATIATANIKRVYEERLRNHDFIES